MRKRWYLWGVAPLVMVTLACGNTQSTTPTTSAVGNSNCSARQLKVTSTLGSSNATGLGHVGTIFYSVSNVSTRPCLMDGDFPDITLVADSHRVQLKVLRVRPGQNARESFATTPDTRGRQPFRLAPTRKALLDLSWRMAPSAERCINGNLIVRIPAISSFEFPTESVQNICGSIQATRLYDPQQYGRIIEPGPGIPSSHP